MTGTAHGGRDPLESASGVCSYKAAESFVVQLQENTAVGDDLVTLYCRGTLKGFSPFLSHKLAFTTTHTVVTSRSIMSPSYTTPDSQLHTEHYNQGRVLPSILTQHDKLWTHFLSNEIFFFFCRGIRAPTSTENYNRNWLLALPYLLSWKLSCCLVLLPNSPEAKWAISQTCLSSRKWREWCIPRLQWIL